MNDRDLQLIAEHQRAVLTQWILGGAFAGLLTGILIGLIVWALT